MRVGYLGPPGTYSHEALGRVVDRRPRPGRPAGAPGGEAWEEVALASVHAAVVAVQAGEVDRALVPLENSLEGSVNATLDALALDAPDVVIAGEVLHPVHHCLIAGAGVGLGDVRVVTSHPQGSAQCAGFLRAALPEAVVLAATSTADAVRRAVEGPAPGEPPGPWAAIGSRAAAALYGGTVLREGIEDAPGNETRFAWLAPAGTEPLEPRGPTAARRDAGLSDDVPNRDPRANPSAVPADHPAGVRWKTALVWWGAGSASPGWLVRCLSEFAFRGVNLTRIESRPRRGPGIGEYMFFADLDGHAGDDALTGAISGLRAHASTVRVLGTFPAAQR